MLQLTSSSLKLRTDFSQVAQLFPVLVFDKKRLQQVLFNLLIRAFKSKKKGTIKITAFVHSDNFDSGMLEVTVCDKGTTMSQDEMSSIFDTIEIDNSSSSLQRHKPGLQICRKICQNLGGDIEVHSKPNLGSRFKFTMRVIHSLLDFENLDPNEMVRPSEINLFVSRQSDQRNDRSPEIP